MKKLLLIFLMSLLIFNINCNFWGHDSIEYKQYWEGTILIGMTGSQVMYNIGDPTKINITVSKYGKFSQWVYSGKYAYVYFENGKVTSYQK